MAKAHPPVEFRHVRYFLAAVEQGSFRKAGLILGIQESAISRRIRDLEDHLGISLFHRCSAGGRLTFAGQRFLPRAQVDRHNLLSLVGIGSGLTLTSEATIATRLPDVCYRPIKDEVPPFSAVWSPKNDNPALSRILSLARRMSVKRSRSS